MPLNLPEYLRPEQTNIAAHLHLKEGVLPFETSEIERRESWYVGTHLWVLKNGVTLEGRICDVDRQEEFNTTVSIRCSTGVFKQGIMSPALVPFDDEREIPAHRPGYFPTSPREYSLDDVPKLWTYDGNMMFSKEMLSMADRKVRENEKFFRLLYGTMRKKSPMQLKHQKPGELLFRAAFVIVALELSSNYLDSQQGLNQVLAMAIEAPFDIKSTRCLHRVLKILSCGAEPKTMIRILRYCKWEWQMMN